MSRTLEKSVSRIRRCLLGLYIVKREQYETTFERYLPMVLLCCLSELFHFLVSENFGTEEYWRSSLAGILQGVLSNKVRQLDRRTTQ